MGFKLMLFLMYMGLKCGMGFTALINKAFREKLKEKDFTMLIKTKDNKIGRSFTFKKGKISSKSGDYANPDLSLIWKDAATAMNTMKQAGDPQKLMSATIDGSLSIAGDASIMMWFIMTINQMLSVYGMSLDKQPKKDKKK